MRSKALAIALAVAGYLTIEAALIWYSGLPKIPEMVVLVSTLGMLAGLVWGGRPSVKHALRVEAAVIVSPVVVAAYSLTTWGIVYVIGAVDQCFQRPWVNAMLVCFFVTYALIVFSSPTVLYFISRKLPYRGLNAAADQWLPDRTRYGSVGMRRRSRIKRWSLCLPTLTVLLILSVWAPLQGTLSYPLKRRASQLAGGKVNVPISWIAFQQEGPGYHNYLVAGNIHGMVPATILFGRKWAIFSYISIRWDSTPDPDYSLEKSIEEARELSGFRFHPLSGGLPNMTCWENHWTISDFWTSESLATCAAEDGTFLAEFNGDRADLNSFYEIVSSAEVRK